MKSKSSSTPATGTGGTNTPISQLTLPKENKPAAGPADTAVDLYGDQGFEESLSADKAPPGAPLRSRKTDPFFKLSNPRLEAAKFPSPPGQHLLIDFQSTRDGPALGLGMMVRTPDGTTDTYTFRRAFTGKSGTISLESGFGPFSQLPRNAELFLTVRDNRYNGKPTFKVSNSVTLGQITGTTLPRNWTAKEADMLRNPPPPPPKPKNYDTPNLHPNVGTDTPLYGEQTAPGPFRYVDPEHPLLGFDYWMSSWDNGKKQNEPSPAGFVAIFSADQPLPPNHKRVMARPGYAVGAVTLHYRVFVNALQLTYYKIKPDGTLDPSDKYQSEMIGDPQVDGKTITLGGGGKRVIGYLCRRGAILNSFGLVMEK